MKATEANLLDFLKKSPQFVIPIYQRTYSWTERECQQLWDDIIRAGENETVPAHFIGSIVYIEKGLYQVTSQSPLLVIDGQQRLTTVMLILEAIARAVRETEPIDGFSAKKIRSYYLLNPLEDGDKRFKLLLTQTDKDTLLAIVQEHEKPRDYSVRVHENFRFFTEKIKGSNLTLLCKGLSKLIVVDVALSRDQDNPQLIFESMNSTGRELSQADLIRNFILMGLEPVLQTKLYEEHWRPMEIEFGQEAYGMQFDGFMRHFLTLKTGEIPNVAAVYEAFKAFARMPEVAAMGVEALVADIHRFASYYCTMALQNRIDSELLAAFRDLRELKVDVAYPLLLELYADWETAVLSEAEFVAAVRLIESYVFRRAVCAIPTNSLNKTFATLGKSIRKDRYLESIKAQCLLLPSYRRFPSDEEFVTSIETRDLYNFSRRSYWLRRMENFDRKERVVVEEYTIEHILPQTDNLSSAWKTDLGPEWERIQKTWLHTLGNLTLTGYNPELSDQPFLRKRDMVPGGFRDSPIRLNEALRDLEAWNEDTIRSRAAKLAAKAVAIWQAPYVSADSFGAYKQKRDQARSYTLEDHANLARNTPMRQLYEELRKEVLALDPCVTEEVKKLYVAFKAETNFVDVIPQKSKLILSLNIRTQELHDPRQIGRDVSGLGKWGNGDVEVPFGKIEDLPYILGLVRQALEKQLDSVDLDN